MMFAPWTPTHRLPTANVFLVGGAVRDLALGHVSRDKDFVVVGLSPEFMEHAGFSCVGKDFPVFLDPDDNEEYALARIERKVAPGYHGFETVVADVGLEDDLRRRDLTINAMALDPSGCLIDPFGGYEDIQNRVLRHVSDAFAEDPVRVLRVARFAARFAKEGFTVAPETMALMKEMVARGEVDHLVPERIWLEFSKIASTPAPSRFLQVLHECGALQRILPEVDALYGVPQVAVHHPEVDTGIHTEMVLDQAVRLAPNNVRVAFAALTHDLGKACTDPAQWPKHHDHEQLGLPPLEQVIARWKVPNDVAALARSVCEHHLNAHRSLQSRTGTLLGLVEAVDGLRNPDKFEDFLRACEADKRGRLGLEHGDYDQAVLLRMVLKAARGVSGQRFADQGLTGLEIKSAMRDARLRAVRQAQNEFAQRLTPSQQPSVEHQPEAVSARKSAAP